ncbi:MAG: LPS export ABC transporter periplasmic protein LptC [Treponema sp.]|nr:LPS export ABC transporter periplasmic protein LptC [Treponema sp.]
MMKNKIFTPLIFSLCLFSACSLKYTETPVVDSLVPEFVFEDVSMKSYEDKEKLSEVNAGTLEQYKNSSESYARNLNFKSFNKEGKVSQEGSCGYLFADTKKESYQLFDDITIKDYSDNINFYASALQWDGKNEQLTSGKSENVKVEKDDTVIVGSGFSASGVSRSYRFTGSVSGSMGEEAAE